MENKLSMSRGQLYLIIAAALWSFGGVCIKFIPFSAMAIVGLRGFLAYIVLCIYRRSFKIRLNKSTLTGALRSRLHQWHSF